MHECHRVIEAHGFLFVVTHEVDQVIGINIGAKLASICPTSISGRVDVSVLIAFTAHRVARLETRPHCPVIEPVLLHGLRFDPEVIDLPLACRACGVAKFFHQASKGGVFLLFPVKVGHSPARNVPVTHEAVSPWVFAGQKGHARRGACRHGVGIVKLHSTGGERVNVRGRDILCTVGADPILAQVIHHNEEDVWFGARFLNGH